MNNFIDIKSTNFYLILGIEGRTCFICAKGLLGTADDDRWLWYRRHNLWKSAAWCNL